MAYTTITAATIGLADGDTSPQRLDGTVRITPRFPSLATSSGFIATGPVVVSVVGGDMPETEIPAMTDATGVVEFHLYDRSAGPVKMPHTEIPLEPDTTISLHDFLPVGVDPVSGASFIKGEMGPQGPQGERGTKGPKGDKGDTGDTGPEGPEGPEGPQGDTGLTGPEGPEGPQGIPGQDGKDGTGVEILGDLESEADLPPSGTAGDAYMISGDMHIWDVTDAAWVNVGPIQGPQGPAGADGEDGPRGPQGIPGEDGAPGADGADGQSAYEVAVAGGFIGTEAEWLASLIGPEGPQGPQGDPGQDGAPAPRADLISSLEAPMVIAHRGGGARVYPEEGLRGMIAAAEDGFLPEMDIQFLSDGTPVLCHDTTVDRTMTGASGEISNLTLSEWRRMRIRPVHPGGRDDRPLTFNDALDYLGGRAVLVAEISQGATIADADRVINAIASRGLERAILLQSFDYEIAQHVASNGMEVVFLCFTTTPQPFADIKADGINFLGPSVNMTSTDMNAAANAGLKVVPFAVTKRSHVLGFPDGVFGYFSDDPWWDSGRMPSMSAPGWSQGESWPGRIMLSTDNDKRVLIDYPAQLSGGNLYFPYALDTDGSSKYDAAQVSLDHMTGGPLEAPFTMYAKYLYGSASVTQFANVGFTLYRNELNPDAPYYDTTEAGQWGYTFGARRNGTMQGWHYIDGAAASSFINESYSGSGDPFPAGSSGVVELMLQIDASGQVKWINLTTGVVGTGETPVAGPLRPMLRVATTEATLLDIAIYRSPIPIESASA